MTNVTDNERWIIYLDAISDGANGVTIARKTGISKATISRWQSSKADPQPRQVVAVARAYGVSPIAALVAAGYLEAGEVDLAGVAPRKLQLREFTDLELSKEIVRRVEEGESVMLDSPLDENHPAMQRKANVSRIDDARSTKKRGASRTDQDRAVAKPEKTIIDVPEFDE